MKFRNICTIAHVDHGKTTLVDGLLSQAGMFAAHKETVERIMDSGDLEKERGITINAKCASLQYQGTKVNIVDTPGHADFGGEVERIMSMVDGAILLVDAAEGPLPQTRFVLQKAIEKDLRFIVCINKVDRGEVRNSSLIADTENKLFDLFIELGASDEQCDFPVIYACARDGWCCRKVDDVEKLIRGEISGSLEPLFELMMSLPAPQSVEASEPKMMVSHVTYSDFLGALALGRLWSGELRKGKELYCHGEKGVEKFSITSLLTYKGTEEETTDCLEAGDIGLVAGCGGVAIGDTIGEKEETPFPRIEVEEPTMRMIFSINTSPFSGQEGKPLQSRELRQRLVKETFFNPALRLEDTEIPDQFYLYGRGELQFGVFIETLRREGLEFMVGKPGVLTEEDPIAGKTEPFEKMMVDIPEVYTGDVTQLFQQRKGILSHYEVTGESSGDQRVRLTFEIPTRGILGTKSRFLTITRGHGLINSEYIGHRPYAGWIPHRQNGSIIADRAGETTAYALESIQQRGQLFVGESTKVYEGMIIGECNKDTDLNVNGVKQKKLTNVRTTSSDGLTILQGIRQMSLENCMEWIEDNEWIEVTPKNIRLRKKVLPANQRSVRRQE